MLGDAVRASGRDAAYRFLEFYFLETLGDEDLRVTLSWAVSLVENQADIEAGDMQATFGRLAEHAWKSERLPYFAEEFARFLLVVIRRWHMFYAPVSTGNEARRTIAVEMVRTQEGAEEVVSLHLSELLRDESLEWVVAKASEAADDTAAAIWARVAFNRFRNIVEREFDVEDEVSLREHETAMTLFDALREGRSELSKKARQYFEGEVLDDMWVKRLRESAASNRLRTADEKKTDDLVRSSIDEIFPSLLENTSGQFWRFARLLRLKPLPGDRVMLESQKQIFETRWWQDATGENRAHVTRAAEKYVLEGDAHADEWFGQSVLDHRAEAGYLALQLCCSESPSSIQRLSAEVWARWMPVLVSRRLFESSPASQGAFMRGPTYSVLGNHNEIVALAAQRNPGAFTHWVNRQIDVELDRGGVMLVLDNTKGVRPPELVDSLVMRFGTTLRPEALQPLLAAIAEKRPVDAERLALAVFDDPDRGEASRGAAAVFLIDREGRTAWPRLWPTLRSETTLARAVVEQLGMLAMREEASLSGVAPGVLAELWEWLSERWPYKERDEYEIHLVVSGEELREATMRALVSLGTDDAAAALHRLADAHPELSWLRSNALRAEASAKARRWTPWTAEDLACASNSPPSIDDPAVRDLVKILSTLYKTAAVERVCHDAGISTDSVLTTGTPLVVWDDVVREALNADRLRRLVSVACTEYPGNTTLRSIARRLGVVAQTE